MLVAQPKLATIFISYSLQDAQRSEQVARSLEEIGLKPWLARREVRPGESFVERIDDALTDASYVVLLVSRASMASSWVKKEWMSALARKEVTLVPVRLDETPLPALLSDVLAVDFTRPEGRAELQAFFRREASPAMEPTRGPSLGTAIGREIRIAAQRCLNALGFQNLLYDLQIDEGELAGDSLHLKIVSLLRLADQRALMPQLLDYLERDHDACVRAQISKLRDNP